MGRFLTGPIAAAAAGFRVLPCGLRGERSSTGIRDLPTQEHYRRRHNTAGRNTRGGDGPLELLLRHPPDDFVRPSDDPLPWLLANTRGLESKAQDLMWLSMVEVPRALQARSYDA